MSIDQYTAPYHLENAEAHSPILLIADHASNALPPEYGDLGLPAGDLERHIAYDVGVAGVTRGLASELNATAVLSGFSRLLIDPNRAERDPTLIMKLSDGSIIEGNRHVDAAETERRLEAYYRPYDRAVSEALDKAAANNQQRPAIVSIHSFTPQLQGRPPRPWHIGVLFDSDPVSAKRFLALLEEEKDLCVGENVPYAGSLPGETLHRHAAQKGLPHILIEIRNDLIETEQQQKEWAARLAPLIRESF